MADDMPYKMSAKLVDGVGLVLKLDEVKSYSALLDFETYDEDETIVIPSATCPEGDLNHIEEWCKKHGFSYQPPSTANTEECGGGSGEGNDQSATNGGEPGEFGGGKL